MKLSDGRIGFAGADTPAGTHAFIHRIGKALLL
jgi:hypothetical protein